MAVLTPDDARDALGFPNLPPELAAWINYMVNQAEVLADALTDAIYEQTKAAVEQPRDPAALKAAEKMWRDDARKRAETLATGMSQAQLKAIGKTIADGLEQGLGPKDIARNLDAVKGLDAQRAEQYLKMERYLDDSDLSSEEIERKLEKYFQDLLRERKETIARTEAREATAEAALQKNRDRGARFKVWITAGDDRVSDECQENEAEGPIPIDDEFPGGVDRPPQHPNCRCTCSYITSDEQLERAEARAKDRAAKTAAAKEGDDA